MFKKLVLPTIAISTMIFASFTTLIAEYGFQRIEIEVDNQAFFDGQIREVFSPGMAAALNLTIGLAGFVAIGYGKSIDRKQKLEKQLLSLKAAISDKDVQIQEFQKYEKIDPVLLVEHGQG